MADIITRILAPLAAGLMFGLMNWVLNNLDDFTASMAIAFILGGLAEASRRWIVEETNQS